MTQIVKLDHTANLATKGLDAVQKVSPIWLDSFRLGDQRKPLLELISIGLNRDTLGKLITTIETGQPLSKIHPESDESNAYLAKILREEVQKQFAERKRPLVELVLNGIDARPTDFKGVYVVEIEVGKNSFEVSDNGKGMSLQKILDTLIIPFNSDKNELIDIGRFGIGFFSNLQYCLESPGNTAILVRTGDGKNAYELKVDAAGNTVDQLVCSIRRISSPIQGTTVQVKGIKLKKQNLDNYLDSNLKFFDPRRAIIKVNGKPVNLQRETSPLSTEYSIPVSLKRGGEIEQEVRVAIDIHNPKDEETAISLYSQGIFVKSHALTYGTIKIDFPSAVYLVEGRDQFKNDNNYRDCIQASLEVVIKYCEDHRDNIGSLRSLRELLPTFVDALDIHHETQATTKRLKEIFFPEKTYVVVDYERVEESVRFRDFFGDSSITKMYIPKTNRSCAFWRDILPGNSEFVKNNITVLGTVIHLEEDINSELMKTTGKSLQNLKLLRGHATAGIEKVLVKLKDPEETRAPFLYFDNCMYINVDHTFFQKKGYVQGYGLRASFTRELIGDEEKAEQKMISV